MKKEFYFDKFEDRVPPEPVNHSIPMETLWQFLATANLIFGGWYISWRWTSSINWEAWWFSLSLLTAETCAYIGLILFTVNLWKIQDYEQKSPPKTLFDCINDEMKEIETDREISIDIFFPSYDEDPELVRLSILDAKNTTYPHKIDKRIHVLDDGKRDEMKKVADEEGIGYITRDNNIGFKAGNMRNAMEKTSGDFIVICDADTRPFSTILEDTLGYFRDPDVAWVQTPQWFFDIPEGKNLRLVMKKRLGAIGFGIGWFFEKIMGPIKVGQDPFVNDPRMFYDAIQRRRNWANASFCCGAGSIHRREAVMEAALKTFSNSINDQINIVTKEITDQEIKGDLSDAMKQELLLETEFTPYKFHVSEDIYTSIALHSDPDRNWKSVFHPKVESKMLSPQDLYTWTVQRFKYAGGTLDLAINDKAIFNKNLSFWQKIMYFTTFWSYLGGLWNVIFLIGPALFLFTGISPISAYTIDFYLHIIPFLLANEIAFIVGTWGIPQWGGKATYLGFFPVNLRAIFTVLKGEKIKFPVTPKDRQEGNFFHLVIPQFLIALLTLLGIIYASGKYMMGFDIKFTALLPNVLWGFHNIMAMTTIILAAFWKPEAETVN